MSFFSKLISAAVLALALTGPTRADPDFEVNAKGMTLSDMIGRTMVGVTRDGSSVFSMHLARDGATHFTAASGKAQTGRWRRVDSVIVCIKGLVAERPQEEVCKRAPETGRGLDWMTVTLETKNGKTTWAKATRDEHRGSSQMVFSLAGNVAVNRNSYVPDVTKWAGHIIVGRTLKDREAWSAKLDQGGAVDFVFASGRRFQGRYTLKAGEICMTFPQNPSADGCRRPTVKDRKVLWASSTDGGAVSEIVFMHPVAKAPAPVAPPAPQGPPNRPHEALVMAQAGQGFHWPSPDRSLLVAHDSGKRELVLWDSATGMRIGAIPGIAAASDVAWSGDGARLAVVAPNGVELFDMASGRFLGSAPRASGMADMTAAALMPDGRLVIGTATGEVVHLSPRDGTVERSLSMQAGGITDLVALPDGRLGVATVNGRIVVLDQNGNPAPGLDTRIGDRPGRLDVTGDGRWMVTTGADGRLHLFDLSPGAMTPMRSNRLVQGKITQADVSADGRLLTLAFDTRGFAIASLPDLTGLQTFAEKADSVTRATLLPGSPSLAVADAKGRLAIWVPDATAARALAERNRVNSPARQARGARQSAFALGSNDSESQRKVVVARMMAAFDRGDCAAVDLDRPSVRLADQPGDCAAAAERRALRLEYDAALAAQDCDAAGALAPRLGLSTSRVDACRRKVQQAEDQRRFDAALAAGDCEAVRTLALAVNKPQAGADCDLAAALAADSPRRMFLAAVRFDTAGDLPRARQLYDAVMAKFPDDDLALDAARRLTQLADMDKQKAAADAQAAAQAAAVKAAEERAKAAEAAARKAADEAERQRKAREEEARRADAARREAEAAAAAAAAARQQPARNTACDHVYVGKEFQWEAGSAFGVRLWDNMQVVGVSQFTGRATVRNKADGRTSETYCDSVP